MLEKTLYRVKILQDERLLIEPVNAPANAALEESVVENSLDMVLRVLIERTAEDEQKLPITPESTYPPFQVEKVSDFRENDPGELWDNKLQFMLAIIGYGVGLGNLWKVFHYLTYNGGELAVGQRFRMGSIGAWNQISPHFAGIGITSAIYSVYAALNYSVLIGWSIYYFVHSFQSSLPWIECPKNMELDGNWTVVEDCRQTDEAFYFWEKHVLKVSKGIHDIGSFNWPIALCILCAWLCSFLCLFKGIISYGKVVYATMGVSYLVLLILFFIRGITLEGVSYGFKALFNPQWSYLGDIQLWLHSCYQVLSMNLGQAYGGVVALASHNPVYNNCFQDTIIISLFNFATVVLVETVFFSFLGSNSVKEYNRCVERRTRLLKPFYKNSEIPPKIDPWDYFFQESLNKEIEFSDLEECVLKLQSVNDNVFIGISDLLRDVPGTPFWYSIFFLMFLLLNFNSLLGLLHGALKSLLDMKLFSRLRREILTGLVCFLCFCLSVLMFCHGAGLYVYESFESVYTLIPLVMVALFESLAVCDCYGLKWLSDDIEVMSGKKLSCYWKICWKFFTPALTVLYFSAIAFLMALENKWSKWYNILYTVFISFTVIWIPLMMILSKFGIRPLANLPASWFPVKELRAFRKITPSEQTTVEKKLFGKRKISCKKCTSKLLEYADDEEFNIDLEL